MGPVLYDARQDRYRHLTPINTRAAIPLDAGLLPPASKRQVDLPVKRLDVGEATVTVRVSAWRIPAAEVDARVYLPFDTRMRAVATYAPLPEVGRQDPVATSADLLTGTAITRVLGCERVEGTATVAVEVVPDPADPAESALARFGPEARLLQRCRRLQSAWVIEDPAGVHLVRGEHCTTLGSGAIAPEVWDRLDRELPFEPALVLFRGEGALALRDRLCRDARPQQRIPARDLLGLFAEADAAGFGISWGRHSVVNDGVVIEG